MIIDKIITRVPVGNTSIQRIMHGGGILWKKKSLGPGSTKLVAGDMNAGFFGEVPAEDFISGQELADYISPKMGKVQFSEEPWLKFAYKGKVQFIAKKILINSTTYYQLADNRLVDGSKTINIQGINYKIRLIKGVADEVDSKDNSLGAKAAHYSEWNQLMLPIHENAPDKWENPEYVESDLKSWNINYTSKDLGLALAKTEGGIGFGAICQDRVIRGTTKPEIFIGSWINQEEIGIAVRKMTGWRPVLELVG